MKFNILTLGAKSISVRNDTFTLTVTIIGGTISWMLHRNDLMDNDVEAKYGHVIGMTSLYGTSDSLSHALLSGLLEMLEYDVEDGEPVDNAVNIWPITSCIAHCLKFEKYKYGFIIEYDPATELTTHCQDEDLKKRVDEALESRKIDRDVYDFARAVGAGIAKKVGGSN